MRAGARAGVGGWYWSGARDVSGARAGLAAGAGIGIEAWSVSVLGPKFGLGLMLELVQGLGLGRT